MKKQLLWIYILSALVYFGQGIGSLPGSAFFFYLKEDLFYDEQKIMYLTSIIGLAWLIKPIWGSLIDNLGLSKKWWMLCSIIVSGLLAFTLGFVQNLTLTIIGMIMLSTSAAVRDVAADAIMCVQGKKHKITGKLQSIQQIAITGASLLTGVAGGWIADHYSYQFAYLLLVPIFIAMACVAWQYKEDDKQVIKSSNFFKNIWFVLKDKNLLLVCLFLFLYEFSPSIGTPLSFIDRDVFGWSRTFIGVLSSISAEASIIGACLYYKFSKKIDLKKWLPRTVFIGFLTTLCYLWYTPITAIVYGILFVILGSFIRLMMLDFMAQRTKDGYEAISFALLCSVINLANTCNGFVGGWLFPIVGLQYLIIISAVGSFLCLPILRWVDWD